MLRFPSVVVALMVLGSPFLVEAANLSSEAQDLIYELTDEIKAKRAAPDIRAHGDLLDSIPAHIHSTLSCDSRLTLPRLPPLLTVEAFTRRPHNEQVRILKNLLHNSLKTRDILATENSHIDFDWLLWLLLDIPFSDVKWEILTSPPIAQHSAAVAGPAIMSHTRELERIQSILKPMHGRMLDIGGGYGFPGFYFTALNSDLSYLGLDIVPAKVHATEGMAMRLGLPIYSEVADVSKVELPDADYYFLNNPVDKAKLRQLYTEFESHHWSHPVYLVLIATWFADPPEGFAEIYRDDSILIVEHAN